MRLALLLACLPALAQAEARHEWGTPAPSVLELTRCPDADCWQVHFTNTLVWGSTSERTVVLDLDGFAVTVEYLGRNYDTPDTFAVLPPVGYAAEPPSLTVEDGAEGVIVIRPVPGS